MSSAGPGPELTSKLKFITVLRLFMTVSIFSKLVFAQSSCGFMKEMIEYDMSSVPEEPTYAHNLSICHVHRSTCCTSDFEQQMRERSQSNVEKLVQDQIILVRHFLDDYYSNFLNDIKESLQSSQRHLDEMFSRTYGPFYKQNSKIFSNFYNELEEYLTSGYDEKSLKRILNKMFRSVYYTIFELMNPLRIVDSTEKECMSQMYGKLKPFGSYTKNVRAHLERSLSSWKTLLYTMKEVSYTLHRVLQTKMPSSCLPSLVRMSSCHVCVGTHPSVKPCSKFCVNVLKGCFAEFAEMETQWSSLLDVLHKISVRLKDAYNPSSVLASIPVQISEGIMHFQEKGTTISNRIIARCFQSPLRVTRDLRTYEPRDLSSNEVMSKPQKLKYRYRTDGTRRLIDGFIERLARLKGFWRTIPQTLCHGGEIATSDNDQCWNGKSMDGYYRKVIASGIDIQRFNPEFKTPLKLSIEKFLDIRVKWLTLSHQLEAVYDGEIFNPSNASHYFEGSAYSELSISPDDEDNIDGSAKEIYDNDYEIEITLNQQSPSNERKINIKQYENLSISFRISTLYICFVSILLTQNIVQLS